MKNKLLIILLIFIVANLISVLLFIFADDFKIEVKISFVFLVFFISTMPGAYQYINEYAKEEYDTMHNKFPGIFGMTIIILLSPLLFCKYIYYTLKK